MTLRQHYNSVLWHAMADDYHQLVREVGRLTFQENEALDEIGSFMLKYGHRFPAMSETKIRTTLQKWIVELREKYADR